MRVPLPALAEAHPTASRTIAVVAALLGEVALVVAGVLLVVNERAAGNPVDMVDTVLWGSSWIGFAVVGVVVVLRRPGTAVGWLMIGITSVLGFTLFGPEYAEYSTYAGPLPLAMPLLVAANVLQVVPFALVPLLLLLFPDGELPHGRMRGVARALVVLVLLDSIVYALRDGPVGNAGPVRNPLGIPGSFEVLEGITATLGTAIAGLFVVIVVDFVRRFRASRGMRRQQFRWLARASLVTPTLFLLGLLASPWDTAATTDWTDLLILSSFALGLPAMAAGIGVAVLRYRLWDIDRIVSRTVTYAVVTGLLAAAYGVLVLGLQVATGPDGSSDLRVAASTLIVVALFRPVRATVQRLVDRRFDRVRIDHERIIAGFATHMRDELDVERLEAELRRTVDTALAPASSRLWLPPGGAP